MGGEIGLLVGGLVVEEADGGGRRFGKLCV